MLGRIADVQKTILVVDDEPAIVMLVEDVLSEMGFQILSAYDGDQGLDILRSDARVDMIISDVRMPNLDGPGMVRASRDYRPDMPILYITGYCEKTLLEEGKLDAGVSVMRKPFRMEDLADRVQSVLP